MLASFILSSGKFMSCNFRTIYLFFKFCLITFHAVPSFHFTLFHSFFRSLLFCLPLFPSFPCYTHLNHKRRKYFVRHIQTSNQLIYIFSSETSMCYVPIVFFQFRVCVRDVSRTIKQNCIVLHHLFCFIHLINIELNIYF